MPTRRVCSVCLSVMLMSMVLAVSSGAAPEPASASAADCGLNAVGAGPAAKQDAAPASWLQGVWSTWSAAEERRLVLKADGAYIACVTDFTAGKQRVERGMWSLDGEVLTLRQVAGESRGRPPSPNRGNQARAEGAESGNAARRGVTLSSANDKQLAHLERVGGEGFRLTSADLGLRSLRYTPVTAQSDRLYPGHWFVGVWMSRPGGARQTFWTFNADGTYRTETKRAYSNETPVVEQGTWRADAKTLALARADGRSEQYSLRVNSGRYVYLKRGGDEQLLSRQSTPPASGEDPFGGQFAAGPVTLELARAGEHYRGSLIIKGERSAVSVAPMDGQISVPSPHDARRPIVLAPIFNGLRVVERPATLAGVLPEEQLERLAGKPQPSPTTLAGAWISTAKAVQADLTLAVMPDGRYFTFRGDVRLEEGVVSVAANRLRFDQSCEPPNERPYALVGNQLLITHKGSTGRDVQITYLFVPGSSNVQARLMPEFDAAIAADNTAWRERIATAPRDPKVEVPAVPNPIPGGLLAVDPLPNDVFANATVFAKAQGYMWVESPFGCIDYGSPGKRCNTMRLSLFPNGRAVFFSEAYVPLDWARAWQSPEHTFIWFPYRIENDRLFVGREGQFELLIGRRRIRSGELCLDNVEWIDSRP